jgi:type I restriction enzyme R subunit
VFWYNAFVILSNGSESRIGSTTADWEHFSHWKRISDEEEKGVISLDTIIRGTCDKSRMLDLIENFTAFQEVRGGVIKVVAKNHQVLGVNRAIKAVKEIEDNKGRLGVFWHTQGSGKSLSMLFFSQKILRTLPGNWTFLVVTDRIELDDQIYKTFAACGAITEPEARAETAQGLKKLLTEDHRYVFSLIQKFRTERGAKYPKLTDRKDIIVITDEAHRSQYDTFAMNMRNGLPSAAFIGFTGTPLMVGEEKTKQVYGDYVSIYNFRDSKEDGATVGLFYENRIPELQLTNKDLNDDIYAVIEEADLDENQEKKLEREFARQYHLITRDDRLETIAKDLVSHFVGRGYRGKAMFVAIDKATAVRMYDKVRRYWGEAKKDLEHQVAKAAEAGRPVLEARLAFMRETDMAVVVSQSQNEIEDMKKRGLDIAPHRKRMVQEKLDEKFKDPDDPFRLVFVCAMWMTGFDVPSCSTIYLDKPVRNHTLMQTIARANRVYRDKSAGIIVDYVGVFRNLQRALSIYAAPSVGSAGGAPIAAKSQLVEMLQKILAETKKFCSDRGVFIKDALAAKTFKRIKLLDDARETLIADQEVKKKYLLLAGNATKLFKAIKPDPRATEFAPEAVFHAVLAEKIRALAAPVDISQVIERIEKLLDESIAAEGYVIEATSDKADPADRLVDLTEIDFDALRKKFKRVNQRSVVERLRALLGKRIERMVQLNRARADFLARFQKLIEEYNAGTVNLQEFFDQLVELASSLDAEAKRAISERLSEEELALFDLLTKPVPKLTKKQEIAVKNVAKELLAKLKKEKLALDWRKKQQTKQAVRLCIEEELDHLPQDAYPKDLYEQKCEATYRHVYDSYEGDGKSVYDKAA